MEWDTPEPAYSEFLTNEQLEKVKRTSMIRRGSVIARGTTDNPRARDYESDEKYEKQLEKHRKDEATLKEMLKTIPTAYEADRFLLEFYFRDVGPKRRTKSYKEKSKRLYTMHNNIHEN